MAPQNILVIGAGVAGTALATFLLLLPLPIEDLPQITLLERSSPGRSHGQNIDIRGTGIDIIRKLGLEDKVRAATTGEEGVRIVDHKDRIWAEVAADKTGRVQTGTSDVEILRGRLVEVLRRRCEEVSAQVENAGGRGVEFIAKEWLDSLDQDGEKVHVVFAQSGEKRSYDLVIGADGLQSQTRNLVWGAGGEEDSFKPLGAYAGFFSMPKGETDSLWRRWYHASGKRSIMIRPSDQGDRSTVLMIALNESESRFRKFAKDGRRSIDEQKALLGEHFADAGWESERIIAEMHKSDDFYYDVVAQVKMEKWSKGRVALLGDAGYCASPFSGMGTTLALNGAYNFAGALVQCPSDYSFAFEQYESKMRPLVQQAQKLPPGMPQLIHPETMWGVWILRVFSFAVRWSGIGYLLAMFAGPPARAIEVEDFGIRSNVLDGR